MELREEWLGLWPVASSSGQQLDHTRASVTPYKADVVVLDLSLAVQSVGVLAPELGMLPIWRENLRVCGGSSRSSTAPWSWWLEFGQLAQELLSWHVEALH